MSHIIEKIQRERIPLTRYVVRLIPLQITFFPKEDDLVENIPYLLHSHLPDIALPERRKHKQDDEKNCGDDDKSSSSDTLVVDETKAVDDASVDGNAMKKQRIDESGNAVTVVSAPPINVPEESIPVVSSEQMMPSLATKIRYCIEYKGRNHNVLNREMVYIMFNQRLRDYGVVDYKVLRILLSSVWTRITSVNIATTVHIGTSGIRCTGGVATRSCFRW